MPFEVDVRDRIGEIVFDHPPVNAFDSSLWLELPGIIHGLAERKQVRCLLIRAEGRGFCAGVDIKELQADPNRIVEVNRGNYLSFRAVHRCEVPVVTAPHGFVLGGGIGLCGASDAIVAADDAYFALPEIDRGAMGGAAHLQRIVPHASVRAAFLTGGQITAEEAWRLGGIARLVPRAGHAAAAREFAAVIASKSRDALRIAKQALNGIETSDIDQAYRREQGLTLEMYLHEDSQKSRDAFVETGDAAGFGSGADEK
ncbi:MAG: enoyl-CoA hydratase family protein [Gammaproteobacteria bacterium]|nr:enoyl-CoA hydratase family protein [Gammaproteobacteria bacterium]